LAPNRLLERLLDNRFLRFLASLSIKRKLTLIYLLDLVTVIYISGILIHEKYISIDFARKEIVGVQYAGAVRNALTSAVLTQEPAKAPRAQAVGRMRDVQALSDTTLGTTQDSAAFMAAWAQSLTTPQLLPAEVIKRSRSLLTVVSNQSNLILDPDLDSYYTMSLVLLRYPELLEVLADTTQGVRAKNTALGNQPLQSTALLILAGRLDAALQGIRSDYRQALDAGDDTLKARMKPAQDALDGSLSEMLAQVQQLANRDVAAQDIDLINRIYTGSLATLFDAWGVGEEQLGRLLQARVDTLFSRMWLHMGTALLLLSCILGLVYWIARLIALPLTQLASVADEVRATGDPSHRANWNSTDEIGRLYTAFNGMLTQLDQVRLVQQELAASARAARAQQELVEAIPIPMVVTSVPDHVVLHANTAAQPWLGGVTLDPWRTGLEPGVRARFFQRLADRGGVEEFEVRWNAGETPSWAVLSARRLVFQGQDAVLTTFTPINVIKLMEQRLELWAKVFEASSESIAIMDADQRILSVNKAFCRTTSYDYYEVIGEQIGMMVNNDQVESLTSQIKSSVDHRDGWQGEVQIRKRSGETYAAWLMISVVREQVKRGAVSHYIAISIDITDRKRTDERVRFLAHHDMLTELPNRLLCTERLTLALEVARATNQRVAVLFIDLDRFKSINDTLGHHVGDGLLRSVATRMTQAVRPGDTVSRLGGDEFVIILNLVAGREEVQDIVERRLVPLIRQPHHVDGHDLKVSCSVGIAMYPDDGMAQDDLMRHADAAMYEAKSSGRDAVRMFESSIDDVAQARRQMEQFLRLAMGSEDFTLHYQPRVLAGTLAVVGAEALLRWHHAELGDVSPARFIPIAEECGLMPELGAWVMRESCRQMALWQAQGLDDFVLSVNLSALQMADPQLIHMLRSCLVESGCNPAQLELEITESQVMNDVSVSQEKFAEIKNLGLKLSIDDFGTGYSSLAYLKRFPIDKLKIDQSFVRDMLSDPVDLAIINAIIVLGHTLGLSVVAEGVEHVQQAAQLATMGCDELQGYYLARPMPADALGHFMASRAGFSESRRGVLG
jgi:diguanylate cyclase (GGDEF)-like protein/PAS domain S-box-containing protein